ncbi:MAG: 30S ribosomal protein S6 [Clostridia bacterium]|nr:30S ribosomal protein S6 [Clostridia bacterium]
MNSYESMLIVSLANGEEAAKATVSKFNDLIAANAEVIQIDEWGKRRLAYLINDMSEGYYTVATFKSESDFPAELQRLMNIDESVMRVMVIKLEHEPVAKAEEPVAEEAAVEEAPAADAE